MNTHNAVKQSRLTAIYKSFYQQMQSKCNCKECEKKDANYAWSETMLYTLIFSAFENEQLQKLQ